MTAALVLALLAVWRLARLLTLDEILASPRTWIVTRNPTGPAAYLVTCPWCISIWTGWPLLLGPIVWPDNRLLLGVNAVLVGSLIAGLGQAIEDRLDR